MQSVTMPSSSMRPHCCSKVDVRQPRAAVQHCLKLESLRTAIHQQYISSVCVMLSIRLETRYLVYHIRIW